MASPQASFHHLMVHGTSDFIVSPPFLALSKGNASGWHICMYVCACVYICIYFDFSLGVHLQILVASGVAHFS